MLRDALRTIARIRMTCVPNLTKPGEASVAAAAVHAYT
jgi:hypothetical protein